MLKSDLHPPHAGPDSDPVLYGVAAALADMFPLVVGRMQSSLDPNQSDDDEAEQE